jgi:hypothetical protein
LYAEYLITQYLFGAVVPQNQAQSVHVCVFLRVS